MAEPTHIDELIRQAIAEATAPLHAKLDAILQKEQQAVVQSEYLKGFQEAAAYARFSDERYLKKILKAVGVPMKKPFRIKKEELDKAILKYNSLAVFTSSARRNVTHRVKA